MVKTTMNKRVLVTGGGGQLGQCIQSIQSNYPELDFTFTGVEDLNFTKIDSFDGFFESNHFDTIVNCAAYTAVDKAETEYENSEMVNASAVKALAEISKKYGSTLIHISTDYVFNGENYRPYIESDETAPASVYGKTKLQGEEAFLKIDPKGLIIRTSWVYSEYGSNFVKTMLRLGSDREELGVIFDQVGSPTYAKDLARVIVDIIAANRISDKDGIDHEYDKIYHFSNEGVCSWYDFAKSIFELSHMDCAVNPIETSDYPTPAKRPHYSVLNKNKIKQTFDVNIPYWKDSLKECLESLKEMG